MTDPAMTLLRRLVWALMYEGRLDPATLNMACDLAIKDLAGDKAAQAEIDRIRAEALTAAPGCAPKPDEAP